jgi:hypothetical protein
MIDETVSVVVRFYVVVDFGRCSGGCAAACRGGCGWFRDRMRLM